ncbi:MAG: protein kinase [Planctomycetes bacterium]|nr:protein kinase [Planctomycetota bacterium]
MTEKNSHTSLPAAAPLGEEATWDQVAAAIDGLSEAWESYLSGGGKEPDLTKWVSEGDSGVRALALPELVKVDLEYRWQHGRSPRKVEAYAELFPELGSAAAMSVELIHEELQVRMQAGDRVTEDEIQRRFPQQASVLCELMGGMAVGGTPTCTYFAETIRTANPQTDVKLVEPEPPTFHAGDRIDDFQLLTQLGKGAFAQVFLARQISMERLVALKISAHKGSEPQTLAQLDHANIVRVFDQRVTQEPEARLLYMEVIAGGTLQEVVRRVRHTENSDRSGRLLLDCVDEQLGGSGASIPTNSSNRHWLAEASWPLVVCQLGLQLAEGLAYAHEKGVMHRDIKPANVLLTPEGAPKLADFNVSYNGGRADESPEDTFGGSLVYMSPEQLQACHPVLGGSPQLVRGASDVYSLGVMLWELLCGKRPFENEPKEDSSGELARIQRMIDTRHYANLTELCEQLPQDCPESLRQVLVRCLQPRKEERYASADEAARALQLCLNPDCWKLLQEPRHPLAKLLVQFPVTSVIVAALIPNALAGRFNYVYNEAAIINPIARLSEGFIERFGVVQLTVNCIAFPLGIVIGVWAALQTLRLLRRESSPEDAAEGGRRVLLFGRFVSLFTLAMWTVSGLVFPIAIGWGQSFEGATDFYLHFFISLALCGFAAVAYPYFFLTTFATRFYLPALVRNGIIVGPRWRDLQTLRKLNRVHLALTVLVPILGVFLALWIDSDQRSALLLAISVGGIGFAVMLLLERYIDRTLDGLETIAVDAPRRMR